MSLGGIKGFASGGGVASLGPGTPVGAQSTDSIAMSVANPGISNILSATLLIGMTNAPANTFGVSLNIYAGASPGLVGFFPVGGITELNSSVLQFAGPGQAVGGTFGIQINQSSGTTSGYLSFTDWNTFNNKVSNVGPVNAVSFANGATIFGPTFQLGPADFTNPGVVTTGGQTFAGDKTFTGVISAQNGTLAAVGFHLGTDVGTGFFRAAVNQLNLAVSGATVMVWGSNNVQTSVPILGASGSTTVPEFSFAADPDTGIYNPGANKLGFVVGSSELLRMDGASAVMSSFGFLGMGTTVPAYAIDVSQSVASPVGVRVKNTAVAVGNVHASVFVENSVSYGQLFKAGASYSTYKNIGPNDLGFYNTGGNISLLSDAGPVTISGAGAANAVVTVGNGNATVYGSTILIIMGGMSSGLLGIAVGTSFASFANTWPLSQGLTNSIMQNDGTGQLQFNQALKLNGTSTGFISFMAGTSTAGYTLIMPNAQGGASTLLVNDGSGNLSWTTIAAASGLTQCWAVATGGSGYGSTATAIRRFAVGATVFGSIVYTASATNGDKWVVGDTGVYVAYYQDRNSGGATPFGISVNQADLTNSVLAWPEVIGYFQGLPTPGGCVTGGRFLNAGDTVRAASQSANESMSPVFILTRVW